MISEGEIKWFREKEMVRDFVRRRGGVKEVVKEGVKMERKKE